MQSRGSGTDEHAVAGATLPLSTRTIVERDGTAKRSLHVFCPMHDRTVTIEHCVACPMCERLGTSGEGDRPSVACTFAAPIGSNGARPVGSVLARFSVCVRVDALHADLPVPAGGLLLVVDEDGRLVGSVEPGPRVRLDDDASGLAIEEHTPLAAALAWMVRRRARQLPVITRDGTVLGLLDDLDAMRSLRTIR
jgi:YD repeat-containing protein